VGGKVQVGDKLKLSGRLEVGGIVEIGGELSAQDVEVGGRLYARKVTANAKVSVGGSVETVDGVHATQVRIGRRGEVKGPIKADKAVISANARVEDVSAKKIVLERDVRAGNLYGERIELESGCHINGAVQYTKNLETGRGIIFAKTPEKVDKLSLDF